MRQPEAVSLAMISGFDLREQESIQSPFPSIIQPGYAYLMPGLSRRPITRSALQRGLGLSHWILLEEEDREKKDALKTSTGERKREADKVAMVPRASELSDSVLIPGSHR